VLERFNLAVEIFLWVACRERSCRLGLSTFQSRGRDFFVGSGCGAGAWPPLI